MALNINKLDRQQVLIPINEAEEISVVSMNGKPEIAICGPEGVYHDTVTMIYGPKSLLRFMEKYFGDKIDD
jgi:hypothetical protein